MNVAIPKPCLDWLLRAKNEIIINKKFYEQGVSSENVKELIVGIALKTISNYINHITENIINGELQAFAVGKEIKD